jgi:hypothetical protein
MLLFSPAFPGQFRAGFARTDPGGFLRRLAVTTRIGRSARSARYAGREAARSKYLALLARGGFVARGIMYIIIGWIALEVAFGHSGKQADSSGALRTVGSNAVGKFALWLLFIGFIGLALWRLTEAIYGAAGPDGHKAGHRVAAAARTILYGFLAFAILKYAIGAGAPKSSNSQSKDLTATVMAHPGGRVLVILAGLGLAIGGAILAYRAWRKDFLKHLQLGNASPTSRRVVERIGQIGGTARGVVFAAAGIFLFIAGVKANPGQAKGVDATLRSFASTPLGPWLLALVALGLVVFGLFSWCEARWRKV